MNKSKWSSAVSGEWHPISLWAKQGFTVMTSDSDPYLYHPQFNKQKKAILLVEIKILTELQSKFPLCHVIKSLFWDFICVGCRNRRIRDIWYLVQYFSTVFDKSKKVTLTLCTKREHNAFQDIGSIVHEKTQKRKWNWDLFLVVRYHLWADKMFFLI